MQNCASYNKWTKRDKLAFIKRALTGSASQVLWDTDRSITDSLTKLVEVLKSRYGGERQAEKHRAELQLRCRKTHETLSDLHHDIRRLTVLAYPKLSAVAREEIACDRFTMKRYGSLQRAVSWNIKVIRKRCRRCCRKNGSKQ